MRSRPQSDSQRAPDPPAPLPAGPELAAVAEIWKRTRRTFEARFDVTSMLPSIAPLQPVTVRCGCDAVVGDVVLALSGDRIIVHRLIWRDPRRSWLLTRGDARAVPDGPIDASAIAGVVDAPAAPERATQRAARMIVTAAAMFGRRAALVAVRTLQIAARSRA